MRDFRHDILPLKNIIFRTAMRIVLNREDAEDIVQDTLVKLWQQREDLERVDNFEAFALTVARNLALDRKEKMDNRHVSLCEDRHDRPENTNEERVVREETSRFVATVIDSLPEKQRTVVQLRDIEGLSYKDIAQVLGVTESDVKVTLFRARNALREKILKKSALFL